MLCTVRYSYVVSTVHESFIKINGHFGVMPYNWDFNESFANHPFIQFLETVDCSISVIVNLESNKIIRVFIKSSVIT
jgi:ATP-dependent helicase/DNAse subunit B